MSIIMRAYAKVNLSLDITGKRPDGYHELEMVMQTVSLYDRLIAEKTESGISIKTNLSYLPVNEDNLVYKAAKLFFEKTNIKGCVSIDIKKVIPVGAGLAGGSADAAATLKILNKMYNTKLSYKELADIGVKIGSDVPYCIYGGTKISRGIGEKLYPVKKLPECYFLLVKPSFSISTVWAYKEFDKITEFTHPNTQGVIDGIYGKDIYDVCENMGNVLEYAVFKEYPVLKEIKEDLLFSGALASQMSGSGPTVFAIFDDEKKAREAKKEFSKKYKSVFLCKNV